MLAQGNEEDLGMVCQNEPSTHVLPSELQWLDHHWYPDIIFFLQNLTCLEHIKGHKTRSLRLKAVIYCITQEGLGWINPDGIILRCVNEKESKQLLTKFHSGFCGGHYTTYTTTHKILTIGNYWPSIFADVHKIVRSCQ